MPILKVGTRGSKLALRQAHLVSEALQQCSADADIRITVIKTLGDKVLDTALSRIGEKGLFTTEIERELLGGGLDMAVHSMKDLPAHLEDGLCIGAVLERENPCDVLLSHAGHRFEGLPLRATVGTSSLRRAAQIRSQRPDITVVPIRGNVETRIKNMKQQLDAIVLAYAGVKRLGYEDMITDMLSPDIMLPAVGQGAIAAEVRESDESTRDLVTRINDKKTYLETLAERTFLHTLHGGCQIPAACLAVLQDEKLAVRGLVGSLDGKRMHTARTQGPAEDAPRLGRQLAEQLIADGADEIIRSVCEKI